MSSTESANGLLFPAVLGTTGHSQMVEIQSEVMRLFEEHHQSLLRYVVSFGLTVHDAEEVAQEVFLSLFRHLCLDRSRSNLRGWIFRVAHNLALRQRYADRVSRDRHEDDPTLAELQRDPAPGPEELLSEAERRQRLLAVVAALPEVDQDCLRLRAEGLRYREIASVLGISLGSVSMSLARSFARLARAEGR